MFSTRANRSERFRRLFKEGSWIVVGQVAAVLGALVGVRLITELLDPTAYGELALGMTVATLINQLILGPLGNGITRFYAPAVENKGLGGYLVAARQLVFLSSGAIFVLLLVVSTALVAAGQAEWIAITVAALILAVLSGCNSILSGIQSAARQRSVVALHQGMDSWLRFATAAALMLWLGATSDVALSGYVLATLLMLGSQYVFFRKTIPKNSCPHANEIKQWRGQIWLYSWPFAAWGVFTWAQISSDRWALGIFSTTQDVGLYAVLFQLGYYPISMVTGMATQFLGPIFFQRIGDASDRHRRADVSTLSWRLAMLSLGMTGLVFFFSLLFHEQIFQLLVAEQYTRASFLLPWVILAGGIFATGQTITLNLMSNLKTRSMMAAKIVTALIGVGINFAGAYLLGLQGIVFAGILFSTIYFCWMSIIAKNLMSTDNQITQNVRFR